MHLVLHNQKQVFKNIVWKVTIQEYIPKTIAFYSESKFYKKKENQFFFLFLSQIFYYV
jgi:hypothetical protein